MRVSICYCDRCGERISDDTLVLSATFDIPSYHSGNRIVLKQAKRMDFCLKCYSEATGDEEVWDYKRSEP